MEDLAIGVGCLLIETIGWDFPGGPVVKTPHFQCKGHRFDPWSGNQDPTCRVVWPKIYI